MATNTKQNCGKCVKPINLTRQKHVYCDGECKKAWHYPKCIEISEERYEEIIEQPENPWLCNLCKAKKVHRRSMILDHNNTSTEMISPSVSTRTRSEKTPMSVEGKFELIYKELQEIRKQRNQYEKTLNDLTTVITDYKAIIDNLIQENTQLKNDTQILHDKFDHLEYTRDMQEQQALNHNIIINGAPEEEGENTKQQVIDIARVLQVNLIETDIKTAIRKSTSGSSTTGFPRTIAVTFNSKEVRDSILKSKSLRKITTKSINQQSQQDRPIYIGEQLTGRKQFLSKIARDLKRTGVVKFAWVKYGDIFIRHSEESRIIKIKNQTQLQRIQDEHRR